MKITVNDNAIVSFKSFDIKYTLPLYMIEIFRESKQIRQIITVSGVYITADTEGLFSKLKEIWLNHLSLSEEKLEGEYTYE